jgi:D-3-phosphoglycerate dehydrogenase
VVSEQAKRVVVTDHVSGDLTVEREILDPLGVEMALAPSTDEETLVSMAATADAMMVCFAPVGDRVVEAAAGRGCAVIARSGIGVDNIAVERATSLGIQVTNVPDYCLDEVADHTLALLLASARGLAGAGAAVQSGAWQFERGGIHRLRGRRLALLGLGRIGTKVAERVLPLGLEIVAHDPFASTTIDGVTLLPSAADAVREADFVSLHAPLTRDTHHLIDRALIERMENSPILVNTSRGPLVDTDAVVAALQSGKLSGLALDVTEIEPLPADHPLLGRSNVIVTPHMAYYSEEAEQELQMRAADEVARALEGRAARCPVNEVDSRSERPR